ncbi:hypothetical protein CMEL01_10871 [Colletotrichum melonis]|uniref:C2H2-type domain-containing protein n=1 Tax=Colletotrichum melonis TaxID=1209925 RepID=A0AAI9Y0H2_9PEZI|nr:hypothetical protein CMEL01_10871 [Colletotrichum melonis]
MPAAGTKEKLRCEAPGCARTYSNPYNLKRHVDTKHSPSVLMTCGKSLPNHKSNMKRHRVTCGCAARVQPSDSAGGNGTDTPTTATTNATGTPVFDDPFYMFIDFNNAYGSMNGNPSGPF